MTDVNFTKTVNVTYDSDGNMLLPLSEELLQQMDWDECTRLNISTDGKSITVQALEMIDIDLDLDQKTLNFINAEASRRGISRDLVIEYILSDYIENQTN